MQRVYMFLLAVFFSSALTGCAMYHDSLVNPQTNEGVNCVASGWGWLGTPMAAQSSNQCIKVYSAAGYIPMAEYVRQGGNLEKLKNASVAFTSDIEGATIYSGPADGSGSWARLANKTPWVLLMNAPRVIPECYKATYNGKESDMICFKAEDHVRKVHFSFN